VPFNRPKLLDFSSAFTRRAGERVLNSLEAYVTGKLRLKINRAKSAVDRPWNRKFLGYSFTFHKPPPLKVSPVSVTGFKGKLKDAFRCGRGKNLKKFITEVKPILRGWINYFRLSEVKGILNNWMDGSDVACAVLCGGNGNEDIHG
jgi:RNA-directed DNA polymerase